MKSGKFFAFGQRLGLVGGGQLARMMALKAHELGQLPHVLCAKADEPAAMVTTNVRCAGAASASDEELRAFFRSVDVVTVESEFHSAEQLGRISAETGVPVYPPPRVLGQLQDRWPQKQLLAANKLPTAEFVRVDSTDDLEAAYARFPGGFVVKKRYGGYDGYGTFVIRDRDDVSKLVARVDFASTPCIAEAFVKFRRELAVVFARNPRGQIARLPLVQTFQVDNRLDWLRGPIRHRVFPAFEARVKKFLAKIDYVGVIAFELFDTGAGLLVNEIAPRVHNSAHYSLEVLDLDQFTLHVKAVLNADLRDPRLLARKFSMVNLIGAGNPTMGSPAKLSGHLHWYGKTESRAGRKMGHVTYLGDSRDDGLARALRERKGFAP